MTSSSPTTLQQQLDQERARLKSVETARRDRQDEERRELESIAASKQLIAALEKQQAEQQFEVALQQNAQAVQANNADVQTLHKALSGVEGAIAGIYPQCAAVDASFEKQQRIHDMGINAANVIVNADWVDKDGIPESLDAQMRRAAREVQAYEHRIEPALLTGAAAVLWVGQAKDENQLRIRLGIVYALTGIMYTVDLKTPPTDAMVRSDMKKRISRIRF